ncbi:MAG: hypothetical protein R2755_13695 [Acidimicrobiales bacterium]
MYFSSLGGAEDDPEVLGALGERRVRLQAAIGRQARLRRTPELHFAADSGVREGWKVEEILREIGPLPDEPADDGDDAATDDTGADDAGTAVADQDGEGDGASSGPRD